TQDRAIAALDEIAREVAGVFAPKRIQTLPTETLQQSLAICAHVGEIEITERNRVERGLVLAGAFQSLCERRLVNLVRRLRRNRRFDQRQTEASDLAAQNRTAYAVDRDAVVVGRHRGDEANHAVVRVAEQPFERERRV